MRSHLKKIWLSFKSNLKRFFGVVNFVFVPKRRAFRIGLVLTILISVFLVGTSVYAAGDISDKILDFFNWVLFYIAMALGWVALKVFALVIIVSSYNNFVTSAAVTKGWVLIRDVCNLFFVLILLVIAFNIILGVEKYSPKKMLFNVVIAAILVNFSKLICGLVIDFGQVVMMTFVNGYSATAGANLVEGLGLNYLLKMSGDNASGGAKQIEAPTNLSIFIALFIAIFILIMTIFVTIFILALLVMRIVQLWILVVLSPAAFMLEAIPIGGMQKRAGDWWSKFGWTVAVGPFMAFFLWLSLLVMSDPGKNMLADNMKTADELQAKSAGSTVSGISHLDKLAQSAIGLALLMASLVIAQEAGGVVGGAAGKFQGYTGKIAKSVGGRMTGYNAGRDRGVAMYKGYAEKQGAKKAETMAKYSRVGEKAFAAKESGIRGLKRTAALPYTAGKMLAKGGAKGAKWGGRKIAETKTGKAVAATYQKVKGKAGGALANAKGKIGDRLAQLPGAEFAGKATRAVGGFVGEKAKEVWAKTDKAGVRNLVAADAVDQSILKKAREQGGENLSARNINKEEDLRRVLNDGGENKGSRVAAAMKLAKAGVIESPKEAKLIRSLTKGDREASDTVREDLMKKQANHAFNMDDPREVDTLHEKIKNGDIDITKQNASAYGDARFMQVSREALGDKVFGKKIGEVAKRSAEHKETATGTVRDMAQSQHAEIARLQSLAADGNQPEAKRQEAEAALPEKQKSADDFRRTVAEVTNDLNEAFGARNVDGSLNKVDGKVKIDPSQEANMGQYIRGLSGKRLADFDMKEDALSHIAVNVSVQQLANLAMSNEPGSNDKVQQIVERIHEVGDTKRITQVAGNQVVMDALGQEIRTKVEAVKAATPAPTPAGVKTAGAVAPAGGAATAPTEGASAAPAEGATAAEPAKSPLIVGASDADFNKAKQDMNKAGGFESALRGGKVS